MQNVEINIFIVYCVVNIYKFNLTRNINMIMSGLHSIGKDVQNPENKQTKMKILKLYQKEEEKPIAM